MRSEKEKYTRPVLDVDFYPAILAVMDYEAAVEAVSARGGQVDVTDFVLARPDGTAWRETLRLLPVGDSTEMTWRYLDGHIKTWLWLRGGNRLYVAGSTYWADRLRDVYSLEGARAFDAEFMGGKIFDGLFQVIECDAAELPQPSDQPVKLGGNLEGCRIGFDLGGSDRKCAAIIDGEVVFSEEVEWDPYFQSDPEYHRKGILDTLQRAAAHLPRIDAIGGSSAGVFLNNEVRVSSLFRGLSEEDFNRSIRRYFHELQQEWQVPLAIVNDGEVTALAASLSAGGGGILGVSLGTSTAGGYVQPSGSLTSWLNEIAFTPVDYRDDAPADEWSGARGCGVQYFSQQAVGRLAPLAGFELQAGEKLPELLVRVQAAMAEGDSRAAAIYETIGVYLGYSIVYWNRKYEISRLLLLGRVMSGRGGEIIQATARKILEAHFPEVGAKIQFIQADERDKRHGQAIAAASLPTLQ